MLRVEKEMLIWWWSFHKLLPGRVESWKLLNPVGLSAALGICRLQTASLLSLSFVQNSGPDLDDWLQPRQSQYHYQLLSSSRPATRACKYTLSIHVFLPGYTWTVLEFWGQWNICKVRTNRQNKQQIKEHLCLSKCCTSRNTIKLKSNFSSLSVKMFWKLYYRTLKGRWAGHQLVRKVY